MERDPRQTGAFYLQLDGQQVEVSHANGSLVQYQPSFSRFDHCFIDRGYDEDGRQLSTRIFRGEFVFASVSGVMLDNGYPQYQLGSKVSREVVLDRLRHFWGKDEE